MGVIGIELDAISVAIVPLLDDDASCPFADVGLDGAANRESELVGNAAGLKPLLEKGNIEVLANEDEAALTLFAGLPETLEVTREHHTDALEDELLVLALDSDDALITVQICTVLHDEALNPGLNHGDVDLAFKLGGRGDDRLVVLMLGVGIIEELGLKLQDPL